MVSRLAAAWLTLACLCAATPTPSDPLRLGEVAEAMRAPGVQVTTSWERCGMVNAFYFPALRHIVLCTELLALPPGVARFIYAHEYAHAVILQRGIPYTGSHEMAADELAAVTLALNGFVDDVNDAGLFWISLGTNNPPWADHPDSDERGWTLRCLASGYNYRHEGCTKEFQRKLYTWWYLLGYAQ